MCNCQFKSGARKVLAEQGIKTIIASSTFQSGSTYSDFMFYRCVSKAKFNAALSGIVVGDTTLDKKVVNETDVKQLADYADNGTDVKKWGVSLKTLLGGIQYTQPELDSAQCDIGFSSND